MFELLNACFQDFICFAILTPATVTWNAIHTSPFLLFISIWSGRHQGPLECAFSFEIGPDIEAIFNAS
jgi:hypothetical protein